MHVLHYLILGFSLGSLLVWMDIHRNYIGRSVRYAHFLVSISFGILAITAHTVNEHSLNTIWLESVMLVATVIASIFWLEASFDIREGRF